MPPRKVYSSLRGANDICIYVFSNMHPKKWQVSHATIMQQGRCLCLPRLPDPSVASFDEGKLYSKGGRASFPLKLAVESSHLPGP